MVARVRHILGAIAIVGALAVPALRGSDVAAAVRVAANTDPAVQADRLAKVRSAFLLQVLRFTRWPDERFADDESPVVVGVPKGSGFAPYLVGTFKDRTIDGRPVVVRELEFESPARNAARRPDPDQPSVDALMASCHVVYIPGRDPTLVRRAWAVARRSHVLVVAEDRAHLDDGAAITLPVMDRKVKLVVNRTCLEAIDVSLRSRVMKLAIVVDQEVRP